MEKLNSKDKTFTKNSKTFYLTYSRCKLQRRTIFNRIKKIVAKRNVQIIYFIICQEKHESADKDSDKPIYHYHTLFVLDKPIFFRNVDFFDINKIHPNIQSPRDLNAVRGYIQKEDPDFLEIGKWSGLEIKKSSSDTKPRGTRFTKVKSLNILLDNGLSKNTIRKYPEILFHLKEIINSLNIYETLEENIENEVENSFKESVNKTKLDNLLKSIKLLNNKNEEEEFNSDIRIKDL